MRFTDWQSRFWQAIDSARAKPFEWGTNDCALFAAGMADAISMDGRYVERARTFSWTSIKDVAELLDGRELLELVEGLLGPLQDWRTLQMGDLVLVLDDEQQQSIAVHDGAQIVGPDKFGLKSIPFRCVKGGWRVL